MSKTKFEREYLDIDFKHQVTGGSEAHYSIDPNDYGRSDYANQCVRCQKIEPLSPCSNCSSGEFTVGSSTDGVLGLFCKRCRKGFTRWTCRSCGTDNAVASTFGKIQSGGCFVATAAFGNYDAPEVVFLRAFRDESLTQSVFGRGFIQAYYAISPPLATVIAKSESLRGVVRKLFLQPIIFLLRYFQRK